MHVEIEAKGGKALKALTNARTHSALKDSPNLLQGDLRGLCDALKGMNATFARMPEKCSPEVYFDQVRPYIYGFEDVVYENCYDDKPQTFRGETGAQSSLVPAIQAALGVVHSDSILTQHLDDLRNYMPLNHRKYLASLDASTPPYNFSFPDPSQTDVRKRVLTINDKGLNAQYNECIEQLWKFRNMHLQYAVEYIHNKVSDPKGTWGTPYMKWLKQLSDETTNFLIEEK